MSAICPYVGSFANDSGAMWLETKVPADLVLHSQQPSHLYGIKIIIRITILYVLVLHGFIYL